MCAMLFLLRAQRQYLKGVKEEKDEERGAVIQDKGQEGRREMERSCCESRRFEMEGAGRPPEMEPGLDHCVLVRYEMSVA